MIRDPNFYNSESSKYSERRYEGIPKTYNQFLFQKRRSIVLKLLSKIINGKKGLSLLDIACADGVLTKATDVAFPGAFSELVGTDIAPLMIEVVQKNFSKDKRFSFYIKNECPDKQFDVVYGLGYLTLPIFESEMNFLNTRVKPGGYYLCTFASSNSIFAKIKSKESSNEEDYGFYSDYDQILRKYFEIIDKVPYGLFIPKLWIFPSLARTIQPIVESIFKNIFPNLFHEKVYLLRKKI